MDKIDYRQIFYDAAKDWDKTHEVKHIGKEFINAIKEIRYERQN